MSYRPISSDDPNAIKKLQIKLVFCEKQQAFMKSTNAYYRKHGTCIGCPDVDDAMAEKIHNKIEKSYSWEKQPYASYELTNNGAEIRRLKQRISQLTTDNEVGFVGWEFEGGKAVANKDNNRLQLLFDDKPEKEQRTALKQNGFHWSPTEGAWQRQLNSNAIYAASRIDFIKPLNGENPVKMQPKTPQKSDEAR